MIEVVSSSLDPLLKSFRLGERQLNTIANRRSATAAGRFIAEGDLVVSRALAAGYIPEVVLCDDLNADRFHLDITKTGGRCLKASVEIRRQATGLGVPLGAIGIFLRQHPLLVAEILNNSRRISIVEGIDNPSNIGSIVRSGVALGWTNMIADQTSSDPLSRRALRVAMGTTFNLNFARSHDLLATLASLVELGFELIALTPDASAIEINEIPKQTETKRAILLGSERTGLSKEALELATITVRIPIIPQVDSLNVATAAAIAFFCL